MNATLGDLVEFVLKNRKGKAFAGYTEQDIAASIMQLARERTMFYVCNQENKVCGIVLATKDEDAKVLFINEILTTEKWAFKEFVLQFVRMFDGFKLRAQRWTNERPRFVEYKTQRLIQLVLKG